MAKVLAIILAAGRGMRAGEGLPKTYREMDGQSILRMSADVFLNHEGIDQVQIVIHPDDLALYEKAVLGLDLPPPVWGGENRADSVRNGLVNWQGFDHVLIHDGARPFVSKVVIDNVLAALETHGAVIPAVPVADALWSVEGENLVAGVPREALVAAQTPQGFDFEAYKEVAKGGGALDDAQSALNSGLDVIWVKGDIRNRKLTFQEDF